MKKLVDTCGWIEWITNGKLADSFASYLAHPTELIIPTLLQYELYKWVCREKDTTTALEIVGITETGVIVPLDTHLALTAADLAKEYGLAMADAIIYATSRHHQALLITANKHFEGLPHVKFFEK